MPRSCRVFKKRKYYGKGYVKTVQNTTPGNSQARPTSSSSSGKKLSESLNWYSEYKSDGFQYTILDLNTLEQTVNKIASCKTCSSPLTIKKHNVCGLACDISIVCTHCEGMVKFGNCGSVVYSQEVKTKEGTNKKVEHKLYDLNIRLVLGLRAVGKGKIAAEKLSAVMNLGHSVSRFFLYVEYLSKCAKAVSRESMQKAVIEAVAENGQCSDIAIAVDGSWQRRGHRSLNGIVSATSLATGKVVDVEVMTKFCLCKGKLGGIHDTNCTANFSGSSGAMEVEGAMKIFHRSLSQNTVRYLQYLGDGDSKAHAAVCQSKPYGDCNIEKIECIGHVQKRMGSRLKSLKVKTKKLPDGKYLGGKGRLTDSAILQIQKYYGLAIRRSTNSVSEMKKAIWAEYFHIMSSNEAPQHGLCPDNDETWCKFRKAMQNKEKYDHTKHFHLSADIMSFIKPIFKDLTDENLLKKCLMGKTQNPNESFNNIIWTYIPKNIFVRMTTMQLGVSMAICDFNDGGVGISKILLNCGLNPGDLLVTAMERIDTYRIRKSDKAQEELEKKSRQHKSLLKRRLEDKYEEEEGDQPSYAPGFY